MNEENKKKKTTENGHKTTGPQIKNKSLIHMSKKGTRLNYEELNRITKF